MQSKIKSNPSQQQFLKKQLSLPVTTPTSLQFSSSQPFHHNSTLDTQQRTNDDFNSFAFRTFTENDEQQSSQLWTSTQNSRDTVSIPNVDVEQIIQDDEESFWIARKEQLSYHTTQQQHLTDHISTLPTIDTTNITMVKQNTPIHPIYMSSAMIHTTSQPQSSSTDPQLSNGNNQDLKNSQLHHNIPKKQLKRKQRSHDDDESAEFDHNNSPNDPPRKQRPNPHHFNFVNHNIPQSQSFLTSSPLQHPITTAPQSQHHHHHQRQQIYHLSQPPPNSISPISRIPTATPVESQPINKMLSLQQPISNNTVKQEQRVQQISLSDQTVQAGMHSSLTIPFTDESTDEDKYVQMASAEADRAKLRHRAALKKFQRKKEEDASAQGLPLSAKDKERERSRRESAVTRRRAEVYIRELERTAKRVPSLERKIAALERELSNFKRCNSNDEQTASLPNSSSLQVDHNTPLQTGLVVDPNSTKTTRLIGGIKQLDL